MTERHQVTYRALRLRKLGGERSLHGLQQATFDSPAVHVTNGAVEPTAPALPATLPANTSLNYTHPNFELRPSAMTFTPGANVHRTPIKATSAAAAAASEDEELCIWLQQKASLTQRVIDKVLPKLHDEDVYDVNGLRALHSIDGLGDVFSRVVAAQVADTHSTHSAT